MSKPDMAQTENGVDDPAPMQIKSFNCRVLIKDEEAFIVDASPRMYEFFGTNEESYRNGMLGRIRRDIGDASADALVSMLKSKAMKAEDFRLVYPSMRADGSPCMMQLDAYAGTPTEEGTVYDVIEMDISDLVEARETAEHLMSENKALLEDSPVALGIYHIKGMDFDLVYTNSEYYRVHCGSREYWDSFKGQSAFARILEEDRQTLIDEWKMTLANDGNHVYDAMYRCIGEDEQIHWIRLKARLSDIVEPDGTRICYASYTNMDAAKRAEERERNYDTNLIQTIKSLPSISVLYHYDENKDPVAEYYSDEFCRLKGCTQDNIREFNQNNSFTPVHPDDREALREQIHGQSVDQKYHNAIYRIFTRDRGYIWVSVDYASFSVGDKRYLYAVYSDIDNLKQQEIKMEHQYQDAQSFIESVTDSFIATARINIAQNQVEMSLGDNEFLNDMDKMPTYDDTISEFLDVMPREQDRAAFKKCFSREALERSFGRGVRTVVQDYLFKMPGSTARWLSSQATLSMRPNSDDLIAFIGTRDITMSKILETVMNDVLVNAYDFISYIDADSNSIGMVSINAATAAIADSFIGSDYAASVVNYANNHMASPEREECIEFMSLPNVIKGLEGSDVYSQSFMVSEYGETRYKRIDFNYIDRESRLIALSRTDFTEVQQHQIAQDEALHTALLNAQQANSAKSDFLSRMSHEIRTPMNAIIGMDILAAQSIGDNDKVADYVGKIGLSARYLLALINDILDMSRIESGKMMLVEQSFRFSDLIDSINTMIYEQTSDKGLDYECTISPDIESCYLGDSMKLQQVLINVLGNSVKFTEKGKISLSISKVRETKRTHLIRFVISDTGIGIPEEHLTKIFEAFDQVDSSATTVYGGTGLGLTITKSIVDLMGGSIKVHSVPDVGSEFIVEVPLTIDERAVSRGASHVTLENATMLVVDDDPIVGDQALAISQELGMVSDYVSSGYQAVERVTIKAEEASYYDFILIDWKMPEMDGVETTKRIRRIVGPDVTIIIISAYDWEAIESQARSAGADMFISKPIFKESLARALEQAWKPYIEVDASQAPDYDFAGKRILIAEDNELNAEIARKLLENKHFAVDVVSDGLRAMETFEKSPMGYYDAVLMDIRMPRVNGLQATEAIRKMDRADSKTIPILAMTANAFDEDVEKSTAAGMNAHLSKPIDPQFMYQTLYGFIFADQESSE